MKFEKTFAFTSSNIKFGHDATCEVGFDMQQFGVKRIMVVTDPGLAGSRPVSIAIDALEKVGIEPVLFDQTGIEPTDISMNEAIRFASAGRFDGFVAVGGGSVIDTAKVANLYSTFPAAFLAYVNRPIGEGRPVPGMLKPLIAIPTTAGTGSESTGVAVFGLTGMNLKTGISHRALKPSLAIIDPENTRTMPRMVAACTGLDVLTHAVESYTAIHYTRKPAPDHPGLRPAFQGANPISDIWASQSIKMVANYLLRTLENPDDDEAREKMMLAATFAGIGFGNAGVHLPHAMSYPVAGMVRNFLPDGYPGNHQMIPHGMAVVLNAPAVFRFTAQSNPEQHLRAAELMGVDVSGVRSEDSGELLSGAIISLMKKAGMPNGLKEVGLHLGDIRKLVEGTLAQDRLVTMSPRQVSSGDLEKLFMDGMNLW